MKPLTLGRQTCGTWDSASSIEWLATNGLGGYACGTLCAANTRRYHGFLMASLSPPVARTLLVAKVDLCVDYLGQSTELSANEFVGGTISPQGYVHLQSFAVPDGIPTWVYAVGDALVQQQIFMAQGANTSYLRLELLRASAPLRVTLKPYVTYRDYHCHARGIQQLQLESDAASCSVQAPGAARPYRLSLSRGEFTAKPTWYWNFWHRAEADRGLDATEDLLMPGCFNAELAPELPLFFIATAESSMPSCGAEVLANLRSQSGALSRLLPRDSPPWIHTLSLASSQFIVRRDEPAGKTCSVIAGYPWFADWGRDTMISLPGIATVLQRYDVAAGLFRTYAKYVDRGMLPNRFPDSGGQPEYNTADAALWMFEALDDYLRAKRDPDLARELFPALMAILHAHQEGTRFGIGVDPGDGLLRAGAAGTQLTWMDAKHGHQAFTPRVGKPVEINALWLNALDVGARLAGRLRDSREKIFCQSLLARGTASFSRFWNVQRGCLFDVIDVDGGSGCDGSVRPNQVLAVSLPYCALPGAQVRAVVEVCARELLTSHGLRSLAVNEPGYIGRYAGDPKQRDSAYHMGTVWSWLLGPFARAHYRVYGDAQQAQSFLAPMQQHLNSRCMGSISEIFDGDAPHTARGCFAQAWSVAEILRAWIYLQRKLSTR